MKIPYIIRSEVKQINYKKKHKGGAYISFIDLLLKYGYHVLIYNESLSIAKESNFTEN